MKKQKFFLNIRTSLTLSNDVYKLGKWQVTDGKMNKMEHLKYQILAM